MDNATIKANLDGDYTNDVLVQVGSSPWYPMDEINAFKYLHGLGYADVQSAYIAANWPTRVAGVTDNT